MNAGTMYRITTVLKAEPTYGDGVGVRTEATRYVRVESEPQLFDLLARIDVAVDGVPAKAK